MLTLFKTYQGGGVLSPVLGCDVKLFAPSLLGARLAGLRGLLLALYPGRVLGTLVTFSSPYQELLPTSTFLAAVREQTERFAFDHPEVSAMRADILWAERDSIVISMSYACDIEQGHAPGTTHSTVCKPHPGYTLPLEFVAHRVREMAS